MLESEEDYQQAQRKELSAEEFFTLLFPFNMAVAEAREVDGNGALIHPIDHRDANGSIIVEIDERGFTRDDGKVFTFPGDAVAGQVYCLECAGTGWWGFGPTSAETYPCVQCKGTGKMWVGLI